MTSREIRTAFLEFFEKRDHRRIASSPLVLPNDPTLLFANAGMNQFKDAFTGRERPPSARAVTVQKCLRVSGKHNDLEMVGRTPRHHTFFEMLGNFSFGDYFKQQAIELAWELLTEVYGVPAERLWVSVFAGTESLPADDEAYAIWRERIGVPAERIVRLGESENFWRMGDSGPCGPCSEIHYDFGEQATSVSGIASTPENDDRRFLEIWNLVFMQFDQQPGGEMLPLPAPSIDTGMGLERIASVIQGRQSNYDSDLFVPLLEAAAARAGVKLGESDERDFSLRVIADHARALCFLVADGVVPANDKRGYVLRRLLRRAIRHGRKLGLNEPFLHDVTPVVMDELGGAYPELLAAREAILEVGRREEQRFGETLATGLGLLETSLAEIEPDPDGRLVLSGTELFRLYDTFGFPLDLARDIAEERGVGLDEAGFEAAMAGQRERAQASWKGGQAVGGDAAFAAVESLPATAFVGYDESRIDGARILALVRDGETVEQLSAGQSGHAVLDTSPFYAESGGQVADHGLLVGASGRGAVGDVQRAGDGVRVHRVDVAEGELIVGEQVTAEIDESRRAAVRRNHTATHLLHAALREVVGSHVKQAGSLVAPDRLRFDFSHFAGLGERAVRDVEDLVNEKALADLPVETDEMEIDEALRAGAMALFGEKYGERVRVVRIGDFSMELCGGTHTARSGELGMVKLTLERGIASGTRRVEAVSGGGSLERFRSEHEIIRSLEERMSVPRERLVEEFDRRIETLRELQRQIERDKLGAVRRRILDGATKPTRIEGVGLIVERVDGLGGTELKELADEVRSKLDSGVVVLGRGGEDKASILVAVTRDLVPRLPAGPLVKRLGAMIGGGGGGRPDMAEAGGKRPEGLDEALGSAAEVIREMLGSTAGD